jgi:hypothetical protein
LPSNRLLLGLAVAAALALGGCASGGETRTLFVLLTDNRLLRVSADGEVLTRVRLGAAPAFASYGSLLASADDGERIYALVRGKGQHIAEIDRDGRLVQSHALPRDVTWRRLAVGPESGRIFLAGDVAGVRRNELGAVELGVRLLVLSPDGIRLAFEPIREPAGRDWYVGWLTVAPDESSVLVSYHGSDTTGSDVLQLDPLRLCVDRTPEWGACVGRNHGRSQWVGDRVLAATGESQLLLLEKSGRIVRKLETGLRNIHLMEFEVVGNAVYAYGDCIKGTGVARVSFGGGAPRKLRGCGDSAAVLDDATLVLGRRWSRNAYGRGRNAALVFVDLETGKPRISIELPEDPADVLAVG